MSVDGEGVKYNSEVTELYIKCFDGPYISNRSRYSDKLAKELVGKHIGNCVVLKEVDPYISYNKSVRPTVRARFECLCNCGNHFIADGTKIRSGRRTECVKCAYVSRSQCRSRQSGEERRFRLGVLTVSAMSSGGFGTTHYQNKTNDNRKHKR